MARASASTSASASASAAAVKTRSEQGTREMIVRRVVIDGVTDIMFDRYPGDNQTQLEPRQKLYLAGASGRTICLPSANLMSFLSSQNTDSAPKRVLDKRTYKDFALACAAYVTVGPRMIPFLRDGVPIEFGGFDGDVDQRSGVYIDRRVARLEKGIPNPKVRPVLPTPWSLEFTLTIFENKRLQEQQLLNVMDDGLFSLGLGTFRGQYGKGRIVVWE